jgi:hypothetical protein
LLANTVPPRANAGGVLFYPLGKLPQSGDGKKIRHAHLTVTVEEETFQFEVPVE